MQGCPYRTQRRGWMDQRVFLEWLSESQAISPAPELITRDLFLDNTSGHAETSEVRDALQNLRTRMRKLPPCATEKAQPLDSFIIRKFKRVWRDSWDTERKKRIAEGQFSPDSGKVKHPHRHWYMSLALKCVETINNTQDGGGISLPRKAMIRTGLSLDVVGYWRKEQLFPHLQEVINKYPENFNGTSPDE